MSLGKMKKLLEQDNFHIKDELLRGLTYEELITTVFSNEKTIDASVIKKVCENLINLRVSEARRDLKDNITKILQELR